MKKILITIILVVIFVLTVKSVSATGLCRAADISSLKNCFNLVNNGTVDNVEITSMITCSGPNACKFVLTSSNRPVWIYGSANTDAGIKRIDNYNYFLFEIKNAAGVNISNLHIDENVSGNCLWTYPQMQCSSPIHIESSNNVTLRSFKIDYAKAMGVEILSSNNVTIRSSTFNNTRVAGIWTGWGNSFRTS